MLERLTKIIEKNLDNKDIIITPDTSLREDLGLNSFELIQMICSIEDEFDVEVPDRTISKLNTVKDVISFLEGKDENILV